MLFSTPILDMAIVSNNHERGQDRGGGGGGEYSLISAVYAKGCGLWAVLVVWKHFAHFGLESGMVFKEPTGAYMYECIYRFQFLMNKNEIEVCEFEMHLKNFLFALKR